MKRNFLNAICVMMTLMVMNTGKGVAQGVAVNPTGAVADTSAMLDVSSTAKGMLVPRMTHTQCGNIHLPATGLMVYQTDSTPGFYYYTGSVWQLVGGGTNGWDVKGNNIYNGNSGYVGIGTSAPAARLHVADSTALFTATGDIPFTPGNLAVSGAGRRMMWYPDMAAFRAGYVDGTEWDMANIGKYSVAMGYGTTASGTISTAMGIITTASAYSSTAMGYYTTASGDYSTAMGIQTTASGDYSTAMGIQTTASGYLSTAIGTSTTSSGYSSTAMGYGTTASGDYSTAIGYQTLAMGNYSTSMGVQTTASGGATAMGYGTTASGPNSTSMGNQTIASGNSSTSTGYITTASGDYSFAAGNGASATANTAISMGNSSCVASGANSIAMGAATASGTNSFALGDWASTNGMDGSFVIGDHNGGSGTISSSAADQMMMRFTGGYKFYTNSTASVGAELNAGANSWSTISDRRKKENFLKVDGEDFLRKIDAFTLTSWNYKGQDAKTFRHYGPMAQDFFAAFGKDGYGVVGNDTTIGQADMEGVSFIAIQALEKRTKEQAKEIKEQAKELKELKAENALLKSQADKVADLSGRLEALEASLNNQYKEVMAK